MSLKYNVAVVDDQGIYFKEYKEFIDDYLLSNGFEADVDHVPSEQDFSSYPLEKPDLFLVDLMFAREDKGQLFIEKIRENNILTDVLFYSSNHDAILKYRSSLGTQGIFFAERDEQNDEVEPLLEKMLNKMILKSNTPRTTRGIVMECVSELDDKIKAKTLLLINKLPAEKRDDVYRKIVKLYKDSYDGRLNHLKDFFDADFADKKDNSFISSLDLNYSVEELMDNFRVTDSNKNFRIMLELYKVINGRDALYNDIKEYTNLLDKRNILAHVTQKKCDQGYMFRTRKKGQEDSNYILTDDESILLRKTVLSLDKLIDKIK